MHFVASFTTLGYRSLYQEIENELLLEKSFKNEEQNFFVPYALKMEDFGI